MSITQRVLNYMTDHLDLKPEENRYLLAVSGGVDSMSLMRVFSMLGLNFEIAHCNFQLRGEESVLDEKLVKTECEKIGVVCNTRSFNTESYAKERGLSIQQAARELRYRYFNELLEEKEFNWIATAHHLDDSVETFFINVFRGTGLKGLTGIPAKGNSIIRPFLHLRGEEIANFAAENKIGFREDSSNASNYYLRNAIRNTILPDIRKVKQDIDSVIINEIENFISVREYVESATESHLKDLLTEYNQEEFSELTISELTAIKGHKFLLFNWLEPLGFNAADVQDIFLGLQKNTKARYISKTHELIRDHGKLILRLKSEKENDVTGKIEENTLILETPLRLKISTTKGNQVDFNDNPNEAQIDLDLLKYPLVVRKWHFGDYFYPLGMQNRKKLSDFFTDLKLTTTVKEQTWVLLSNEQVVWVIGWRIDDRYKVTVKTKSVVKFVLENN